MSTIRQETWGQLAYDPTLDEFDARVQGGISYFSVDNPISAGCLVTGKCNLKCQYCYGNDESLPNKDLSAFEWERVFARLRSWGLMRVDLSGGEPTIRKDIGDIAGAALDVGLNVIVSTNGLILAKKGLAILPTDVRLHISIDSGFNDVHEASRVRRNLLPSVGSFAETMGVLKDAVVAGYRVRVLTCVGRHNAMCLAELGEKLALVGVSEWNVSRVLAAGRARLPLHDAGRWEVDDESVLREIETMTQDYPWMHIRYSNRTRQDGYFLLVLPDGSVATQYTNDRDKVVLGDVDTMTVEDLRDHPDFDLCAHARKWIATTTHWIDASFGERDARRGTGGTGRVDGGPVVREPASRCEKGGT